MVFKVRHSPFYILCTLDTTYRVESHLATALLIRPPCYGSHVCPLGPKYC